MTPSQAKSRREKIRSSAAEVYRNSAVLYGGLVKCSSDDLIQMGYDPEEIRELMHLAVPYMKWLSQSMQTGGVKKGDKNG